MTTSEKAAYLKGLLEGMDLEADKKETKLFKAIIDIIGDIAADVAELEDNSLDIAEELDELSDDLAALEDAFLECDCDDDDDDCDCDDDDCDCDCCSDGEPLFFEIKCSSCENEITIDEDVLELGAIECPNCGEKLEFDLSDIDDDEE